MEPLLDALQIQPSRFPTSYLAFMAPIHAVAAILAAVVFCPLAIFARKGSRFHRLAGYALQINAAIIVVTSFLLLADKQVTDVVVGASVFPDRDYDRLYLALLSIVFAYCCFSGLRVWYRLPARPADTVTSSWIDWTLATVGLLIGVAYIVTSLYALDNGNPLSLVYIQSGALLIVFTLFDFYTFVRPPSPGRFPWWLVHMAKMILVWMILLRFINLRVFAPNPSEFARNQAIALTLYVCLCVAAYMYFRRRFRASSPG
ncbi:MAG: hypothetical protein AAF414_11645 [Pseudomonadota bacterium]